MKDILQDIVANKRLEVERQKQAVPLSLLLGLGSEQLERSTRSMRACSVPCSSRVMLSSWAIMAPLERNTSHNLGLFQKKRPATQTTQ